MDVTVARLTYRAMLGGRRFWLLSAMSVLLLAMAVLLRLTVGVDHQVTADFLSAVAVGALVPLFGLIIGTGVIGPEIDDGSVVYLLSKPIPRPKIIMSKFVVAVAGTTLFAAVPTFVAALVMSGTQEQLAPGLGVAALVASVAYSAIFLLLAVVTRHAVVYGLAYALIWEALLGGYVPGARTLSVQQWSLSLAEEIVARDLVSSDVRLAVAGVLLTVVIVGATWYASQRLRVFSLAGDE